MATEKNTGVGCLGHQAVGGGGGGVSLPVSELALLNAWR